MRTLTITRPDDWHVHFRDGEALSRTVPDSARVFNRVVAMPNLVPPVTTVAQALTYRDRMLAHHNTDDHPGNFDPMMTLYLTDDISADEIKAAASEQHIIGCKLYPAGATTHSDKGVTSVSELYPLFEIMEQIKLPLLVHGEVTDPGADIFDREKLFIEQELQPLIERFPHLPVVLEHITTADAAAFVENAAVNVAATITPQHLLFNRNHMLSGGIRPHLYCLPILKKNQHQQALIDAATSGNPKFFLGTDSAPHAKSAKENPCGCAGCYSAPVAIELYAEVFDQAGALDKLEGFASFYGADFYGLKRNTDTITLEQSDWHAPKSLAFAGETIVPLRAGETIHWKLVS